MKGVFIAEIAIEAENDKGISRVMVFLKAHRKEDSKVFSFNYGEDSSEDRFAGGDFRNGGYLEGIEQVLAFLEEKGCEVLSFSGEEEKMGNVIVYQVVYQNVILAEEKPTS